MYFVGIDWADQKHTFVVTNDYAEELAAFEVPHSFAGLMEFKERLASIGITPSEAACFIETSRGLLVSFLLEHGFVVYPLNPKVVDKHRKPSGAKTDFIDARLLADIGRKDYLAMTPLQPSNELIQELRLLTRDQEGLINSQTRLSNQLIACLKEYYPAALQFFSRIGQLCILKFLQAYPSIESVRNTTEEELTEVLRTLRHKNPERKAREILKIARLPQIHAPSPIENAKSRLMRALTRQLIVLIEEITLYEKDIQTLFRQHKDSRIFRSLPGAGKRLAPKILAEWGDNRNQYASVNSIQALAGTSPVAFQSGKYVKARRRDILR